MDLTAIMKAAVQHEASDIHLVPGRPPILRLTGEMRPLNMDTLTGDTVQQLVFPLLLDDQVAQFKSDKELDASIEVAGIGRFRINILEQIDGVGAVLRVISPVIPTPEELGLEHVLIDLTGLPRGLILATGPTGCGKSTTLASMINAINKTRRKHILTIEDPIEYVYPKATAVVTQRAVGIHSHSFGESVKHALRQDPDIILLGEMRDLETVGAALTLAETGHLVFATMHTADTAQTVERMIDVFPTHQQDQVRLQISLILKAVVCQQLLPRADKKGMVAAREIMVVNNAIANHIRQGGTHEIYAAIEVGGQWGMKTLEKDLSRLVMDDQIVYETALGRANKPDLVHARPSRRH